MIAGLTALICEECVALSIDALAIDPGGSPTAESEPTGGRTSTCETLAEYAVDRALAGVRGADLETDVRTLAAVALLYAGRFELAEAAAFAGLSPDEMEREIESLGPPPPGRIRPSQRPPPG